ncbi:MAG: SBBP repeat-containing protein, partial [candidate division Zixibacteria bacterium]|nr:SBBP repeat-containing protein [candidate division Zixibacteria bacterium]
MLCREGLILTILSLLLVCTLTATTTPNSSTTIQKMNQMPLVFTKNMGQWDDRALFRANAGGATMWFTKEGVTYQFTRRIPSPPSSLPEGEGWSKTGERDMGHSSESWNPASVGRTFLSDPGQAGMPILPRDTQEKDSVEQLVLTAKFRGANPNPEVLGEGQMEYKCNYFLGNDPSKWHTDVPNYEAIMLKDIYPGIDLKYSGDGNGQAAYEFIVAPGADIAQIKVAYEGAEKTSIDADGRTVVTTKWGDMIAAIKTPTNGVLSGTGSFTQLSEKTIGFEADRSTQLTTGGSTQLTTGGSSRQALGTSSVVLSYSTYLGGGDWEQGYGIAVDGNGNAYVAGTTHSSDFPTLNP